MVTVWHLDNINMSLYNPVVLFTCNVCKCVCVMYTDRGTWIFTLIWGNLTPRLIQTLEKKNLPTRPLKTSGEWWKESCRCFPLSALHYSARTRCSGAYLYRRHRDVCTRSLTASRASLTNPRSSSLHVRFCASLVMTDLLEVDPALSLSLSPTCTSLPSRL